MTVQLTIIWSNKTHVEHVIRWIFCHFTSVTNCAGVECETHRPTKSKEQERSVDFRDSIPFQGIKTASLRRGRRSATFNFNGSVIHFAGLGLEVGRRRDVRFFKMQIVVCVFVSKF